MNFVDANLIFTMFDDDNAFCKGHCGGNDILAMGIMSFCNEDGITFPDQRQKMTVPETTLAHSIKGHLHFHLYI